MRDIQISEKKKLEALSIEEEKRKDVMMEIERLKGLEEDFKRQELRKSKQLLGKDIIVNQIKEREYQRMKSQEELAREGQEMLKKIKAMQLEDEQQAEAKKLQQSQVFKEMLSSNEAQIKKKEELKSREQQENESIMQYLLDKQKREDEKRQQELQRKIDKEHEIQKLREAQERASDKNQDLDNIRARRAVEKTERAAREKEKREAEKRARL